MVKKVYAYEGWNPPDQTPPMATYAFWRDARLAGFFRRVVAFGIDWVFPVSIGMYGDTSVNQVWVPTLNQSFAVALGIVNVVIVQGSSGYTLGKAVMRIKLFCPWRDPEDGKVYACRPGMARAALRFLCHIFDIFPPLVGMTGPIWHKNRQTFADMITNCLVARSNTLPKPLAEPAGFNEMLRDDLDDIGWEKRRREQQAYWGDRNEGIYDPIDSRARRRRRTPAPRTPPDDPPLRNYPEPNLQLQRLLNQPLRHPDRQQQPPGYGQPRQPPHSGHQPGAANWLNAPSDPSSQQDWDPSGKGHEPPSRLANWLNAPRESSEGQGPPKKPPTKPLPAQPQGGYEDESPAG